MNRFILAISALLGFAAFVESAGGGHSFEWREFSDHDPTCRALFDLTEGRQEGVYTFATHTYCTLLSETKAPYFSLPCQPPVPPPEPPGPKRLPGDQLPTGVIAELIPAWEGYALNGECVTKAIAVKAVANASASVPDDAAKPSLTAIGTPEECAAVHDGLSQTPGLLASVVWQDYRPADPMVKDFGFVVAGHPSVYLQSPSGEVLYHEDAYDPERLAAAVRKADPLYDPKKDPNGVQPDTLASVTGQLAKVPSPVWVGAAVVAVLLFLRRRQ